MYVDCVAVVIVTVMVVSVCFLNPWTTHVFMYVSLQFAVHKAHMWKECLHVEANSMTRLPSFQNLQLRSNHAHVSARALTYTVTHSYMWLWAMDTHQGIVCLLVLFSYSYPPVSSVSKIPSLLATKVALPTFLDDQSRSWHTLYPSQRQYGLKGRIEPDDSLVVGVGGCV